MQVSPHFKREELECKCGCKFYNIQPWFLAKLELLRTKLGKPIIINSGTRCEEHNATLPESSPNSRHLYGEAVDIHCTDSFDRFRLLALAVELKFNGIGIGKTFIHVDDRKDSPRCWLY
jgi:zinc D-Ala-D-Ala carboxypeptidase